MIVPYRADLGDFTCQKRALNIISHVFTQNTVHNISKHLKSIKFDYTQYFTQKFTKEDLHFYRVKVYSLTK